MSRHQPLRHVAVIVTAALFAALFLVASSTGHPPVHHARATAGATASSHHAPAAATSTAGQDHHVDAHLDLAVLGEPDLVRAPLGRDLPASDHRADQQIAPTTGTDSRGPPTA